MAITTIITFVQIAVSIALVVLILMQTNTSDTGGVFGGGGGGFHHKRRGLEKILFIATIVSTVLFAGLALLNFVLSVI